MPVTLKLVATKNKLKWRRWSMRLRALSRAIYAGAVQLSVSYFPVGGPGADGASAPHVKCAGARPGYILRNGIRNDAR